MAARYIEAIRRVAPHGPYQLGGYSAGGTIAYEMAQQLHGQGEEVTLLAIFDTSAPNLDPPTRSWQLLRLARFLRNLPFWIRDDLFHCTWAQLLNRAEGKVADLLKRVGRISGASQQHVQELNIRTVFGISDLPAAYHRFLSAQYQALINYHPRPYPGRLTLFRARTRPLFLADEPDMNWGQLAAGGVAIHLVPGCHSNILEEPFVGKLAQALKRSLREATDNAGRFPSA